MASESDLLLANLSVPTRPRLSLQRLDPPLEHVAKRTGVRNEFVQLLRDALRRSIVCVVQRTGMQVTDTPDAVIECLEAVLDGGYLRSSKHLLADTHAEARTSV